MKLTVWNEVGGAGQNYRSLQRSHKYQLNTAQASQ